MSKLQNAGIDYEVTPDMLWWEPEVNEAVADAINNHDKLVESLKESTEVLNKVFKNTGSLGCKAQADLNYKLLTTIEAT